MRIGQGYDVHRFCEGKLLTIGGARIPYTRGLEAHSDGDVLIHAICDALLGAAGLRDIGHHFPDTDSTFQNIDSRILLRRVIEDLNSQGYKIGNIDSTVVAEEPRLAPFIPSMIKNLAADCRVSTSFVNVKATTTELLGFAGRKEGIAAHAIALLIPVD
jgi:2-C-methyl-D-erythritol 2,4-cyclodiphosphate synthase|tara:strand:+ start:166 stop:642 length:477 start_codon:yes stop_codon:yes gene_type:complete